MGAMIIESMYAGASDCGLEVLSDTLAPHWN
jgi:hypothetical protein